jgi:hypothetical protein
VLHYPKIPGSAGCPGGRYVAFEKYGHFALIPTGIPFTIRALFGVCVRVRG